MNTQWWRRTSLTLNLEAAGCVVTYVAVIVRIKTLKNHENLFTTALPLVIARDIIGDSASKKIMNYDKFCILTISNATYVVAVVRIRILLEINDSIS